MSVLAILLRTCLIASLILNGSGNALASARIQMPMTVPTVSDTPTIAPASTQPCHEEAGSIAVVPMADSSQEAPQTTSDPTEEDCCPDGACGCDCTHAQASLPSYAPIAAGVEHMLAACALQASHDAPALPHSMRPPID